MIAYKTFYKYLKELANDGIIETKMLQLRPKWHHAEGGIHNDGTYCHNSANGYSLRSSIPSNLTLEELAQEKVCRCLDYREGNYLYLYGYTRNPKRSKEQLQMEQLSSLVDLKIFQTQVDKLLKSNPSKLTASALNKRVESLQKSQDIIEKAEKVKIVINSQKLDELIETINLKVDKARKRGETLKVDPVLQEKQLKSAQNMLFGDYANSVDLDETPLIVGLYKMYLNQTLKTFMETFILNKEDKYVSLMPRYAYDYVQREIGRSKADAYYEGLLVATEAGDASRETLELAAALWTPQDPQGAYVSLKKALEGAKSVSV